MRSTDLVNCITLGYTSSMKTAISIPDELFLSADKAAKKLGLTRSAFIQRALEEYLDNQNQRRIIETLNRVYASVDSTVPAEIARYQESAAQNEAW
jgi:metal-responsive CopG/Arc/MetJ family transcriptional regulator